MQKHHQCRPIKTSNWSAVVGAFAPILRIKSEHKQMIYFKSQFYQALLVFSAYQHVRAAIRDENTEEKNIVNIKGKQTTTRK